MDDMHTTSKRRSAEVSSEGGGGTKKARVASDLTLALPSTSKVLHVRNLPSDTLEGELTGIACPFGRVANVMVLKSKSQAFVEMESHSAASSLLQYYSSVQANIRGRPIYFQFSTRESVTVPASTFLEAPNSILLVSVLNLVYPVTIEALHQVFSKCGVVLKIITFHKNACFQTLIEYNSAEEAKVAKLLLDGQNIYSGCCTLKVQYSSLKELHIKFNNDRTRDFTNPSLPTGASPHLAMSAPMSNSPRGQSNELCLTPLLANMYDGNVGGWSPYPTNQQFGYHPYGIPTSNPTPNTPVLLVSNLDPERITPDILFALFGMYGDVMRVKILYNKPNTALVQFANPQHCQMAVEYLTGCPLHSQTLAINFSKFYKISQGPSSDEAAEKLTRDYSSSTLHRYRLHGSKNYQHICPPSSLLHVCNIPQSATEDTLKELFSQHGEVISVKFLSHDKKMALVQMQDLEEAVEAMVNLHNYEVDRSTLRVSFSNQKSFGSGAMTPQKN